MEKRYQVFVSSTYRDLVEERAEVIQALLELDCLPAAMEIFPAANDDQWTLIKQVIDLSDYYIVIVGGRYGSISQEGVSYTEREYDYAIEMKKPVLGFVHRSPEDIPAGRTDQNDRAREGLDAFRSKVQTRLTKEFASPSELGSVVSRSLVRLMKADPAEGWVRGRNAMTPEVEAEIAELRAQLAEGALEKATLESKEEPDTAGLSQGDEAVQLSYDLDTERPYQENRFGPGSWLYTWNEIFRILGPEMLNEASERVLRSKLEKDLLDEIYTKSEENNLPEYPKVVLEDRSWDQVKLQLRALGLIDKGVKRRAVADRQAYWGLTDRGERNLVHLLALRTGETKARELPQDRIVEARLQAEPRS